MLNRGKQKTTTKKKKKKKIKKPTKTETFHFSIKTSKKVKKLYFDRMCCCLARVATVKK